MTTQSSSRCVVCSAPSDTFLCGDERSETGCLGDLLQRLGDCAALAEELDVTLSRQDKVGKASVGFVSNGGDEQPIPVHLGALDASESLRALLESWSRYLWESNRRPVLHCSACGVEQQFHPEGPILAVQRLWYATLPELRVDDSVVGWSRWLMRHAGWIRVHTGAECIYNEIAAEIHAAWRAVDSAAGRVYLGTCYAQLDGEECYEILRGFEDRDTVTCKACGTEHDQAARRAFLLGAAEGEVVSIGTLVGLVTGLGTRLTSSMVRNLKARKRIEPKVPVLDAEGERVAVRLRNEDDEGPDRFLVADVLAAITSDRYQRKTA